MALKQPAIKRTIRFMTLLTTVIAVRNGFTDSDKWYWVLLITVPLLVLILKTGTIRKV